MNRERPSLAEVEDASDADFVSRWSKLKHRAKDTETAATGNTTVSRVAGNTGIEQARASSTKILTDEDMPPIESLTAASDYADFLSPGVSEGLRKLALRKLFHGEAFNIRDGLDEYDDDFTQFEKLGDIVTSDMQHQIELEAQRKAEQLLQNEDQSNDAACVQAIETNSDSDAPVDQNMHITAGNNDQSDEVLAPADAEETEEARADVNSSEKSHVKDGYQS
jgi:hypothetical protein